MKATDAAIAAVLAVAALALGTGYAGAVRRSPNRPETPGLNRRMFGAAVMDACGRGAVTPRVPEVMAADTPADQQPLIDFLGLRRESLACADVPANVATEGLDLEQSARRNLLRVITATWRVTGPSWPSLDRLLGVIFAVSVVCAYFICRLVMPWPIAALVASLVLLSRLQLGNLADLLPYSKAPFFFVSLLIACRLALKPARPRLVLLLAAAAGALLGFGFGVRADTALNLVVVLCGAAAFLPGPVRDTWKTRAAAAVICLATFTAVAAPVIGRVETGTNAWHWALLGYSHEFDTALDVVPAPYEAGYFFSDSYVATTVDAFWSRTTEGAHVSPNIPAYGQASGRYYATLLKTIPGDVWLRGWAATLAVLDLPFGGGSFVEPALLPAWVDRIMVARDRLLALGDYAGIALWLGVVLAISAAHPRLAAFLFVVVAFLGGYPSIQLQARQIFHLEFLSLFMLGLAATLAWSPAAAWRARRVDRAGSSGSVFRRPAVAVAAIAVFVTLPLAVLRGYQDRMVTDLFDRYQQATAEPMTKPDRPERSGIIRLTADGDAFAGLHPGRSTLSTLLAVDVVNGGCASDSVALTFSYRSNDVEHDFSRTLDVPVPSGQERARVFVPVYQPASGNPGVGLFGFDGVDVLASEAACVARVARIASPEAFPLLLTAVLPPGWRDRPLHQRLRGWGSGDDGGRAVLWSPLVLKRRERELRAAALRPSAIGIETDYVAAIAHFQRDAVLVVNGAADAPGSYLVAWKTRSLPGASVIAAEGTLDRGGLTLGVVDAGGWVARVDIDTPGRFTSYLEVPRAGRYQVIVANRVTDGFLRNRFTISRIAILSETS